ncbi:MAG: aldo/keto reductase [Bryobacterales bacterium]|nr:aldo/keto reductase [Bryobacterales bacterium]
MSLTRRRFLETTALAGAAAGCKTANGKLPSRVLGRTGARVTILAMGGGSRFLMYKEEDKALEALERAFGLGIGYMDTAYNYGNGVSEERVGKALEGRRKEIFVATKIGARDGDEARRILEGSLKRLRTDQVDLIHIHSLTDEEDLAKVEAKGGVLETLYKLRDEKITRFIGVTSHTDPGVLAQALERHDFDCTQMALNAALVGMTSGRGKMVINPDMKPSFESIALPVATRKNLGVIAMKVYAQEDLIGQAPLDKLLAYSLSLPVATAVVGMPQLGFIEENVSMAQAFRPLEAAEMKSLSDELSSRNKAALDRRFSRHADA